ncbi:MAG: hypothetical protein WAU36_11260 [Cyclobacteriaceae bacterium]
MTFIKKITEAYFKPRTFESHRTGSIYEFIGIKTYKKYLPTTGDIVRRWRKIKQIKLNGTSKAQELYKYERQTRKYEWRHLIGFIVFILLTLMIERTLTLLDWFILIILNLLINVFPILLQRHNRIRLINILQNNGHPSPYNAPTFKKELPIKHSEKR